MSQIYGAYRKALAGRAPLEVLKGVLTDDEAQSAARGIDSKPEDFEYFAELDVNDWFASNDDTLAKLQIKVEFAENSAYLIYLNFIKK